MKATVRLSGKDVNINTANPKVAAALVALVKACAERQYAIGEAYEHSNGDEYLLSRILQRGGGHRAYLINIDTGVARNSDKVVMVQDPKGGEYGRGYVTTLPCRKDKFWDAENPGSFIPLDD